MLCDHCEKRPAVCRGSYDNGPMCYACDECCGHGCEDGKCEHLTTLLWRAEAQLAERTRERDELRLGREPSDTEGDAADDGTGQVFVTGWTGRRCIGCNCWVWGGPTRCVRCVERLERDAAIARAEKAERERDSAALRAEGWRNTHDAIFDQYRDMVKACEAMLEANDAESRYLLSEAIDGVRQALAKEGDG
jgi:hypothetical protein